MSDPTPWIAADAGPEARKTAPAAARNRDAILAELRTQLPPTGNVLEIASGTGEHIVHFAAALPHVHWQPSDPDAACRASISAWTAQAAPSNVAPPLALDCLTSGWADGLSADAMLCINMVHIAPWAATTGLFAGAADILPVGAPLILYGPFLRADVPTAPSNLEFDANLRARDLAWGLRDLAAVDAAALVHGFVRDTLIAMPANNIMFGYRKPA
jgi:hypothetical protein